MARLQLLTAILLLAMVIYAAPIPHIPERVDWKNIPVSRETLTILFSCSAALLLCVWTGVHLNVDPGANNKSKKTHIEAISKFVGKLAWATIALLAPDIVLTIAVRQFLVAYEYRRAVKNLGKKFINPSRLNDTQNGFLRYHGRIL